MTSFSKNDINQQFFEVKLSKSVAQCISDFTTVTDVMVKTNDFLSNVSSKCRILVLTLWGQQDLTPTQKLYNAYYVIIFLPRLTIFELHTAMHNGTVSRHFTIDELITFCHENNNSCPTVSSLKQFKSFEVIFLYTKV